MPNATAASGEVGSVEFRSGVAEATSRFWTEHHSGACSLSYRSEAGSRGWWEDLLQENLIPGMFGFRPRRVGTIAW